MGGGGWDPPLPFTARSARSERGQSRVGRAGPTRPDPAVLSVQSHAQMTGLDWMPSLMPTLDWIQDSAGANRTKHQITDAITAITAITDDNLGAVSHSDSAEDTTSV